MSGGSSHQIRSGLKETEEETKRRKRENDTDMAALRLFESSIYHLLSSAEGWRKKDAASAYVEFLKKPTAGNYLNMLKYKHYLTQYEGVNTDDLLMSMTETQRLAKKQERNLYSSISSKEESSMGPEEFKVKTIMQLDAHLSKLKEENFIRNKLEKIFAIQAYINYLITPSLSNYNELQQYTAILHQGPLRKLIDHTNEKLNIQPYQEKIRESNDAQVRRCIEKLDIYIQLINKETFNFSKGKKTAAAKAYMNYLIEPSEKNRQAMLNYQSVLREGRLASIVVKVGGIGRGAPSSAQSFAQKSKTRGYNPFRSRNKQ